MGDNDDDYYYLRIEYDMTGICQKRSGADSAGLACYPPGLPKTGYRIHRPIKTTTRT